MRTSYLALLVLCFDFALGVFISKKYAVPEPTIVVYSPKGFEVRIPHEDGITLFAFHGNINREMEHLEAGQFSKDILKKKGDQWIFEDNQTKLKTGDTIYYWLFVIKENLGYRLDDGVFTVKDIVPLPQTSDGQIYDKIPEDPQDSNVYNGLEDIPKVNPMCEIKNDLTDTVQNLQKELQINKEINSILRNLVSKDSNASRTLKFEGRLPPDDDATYVARIIINERLSSSIPITNAAWDSKGHITFEVRNLDDKISLVRKAKEKLVNSKIRLVYL